MKNRVLSFESVSNFYAITNGLYPGLDQTKRSFGNAALPPL
jgi:hypothetical protein